MKQLYILLALIACIGSIRAEYCYNNVVSACGAVGKLEYLMYVRVVLVVVIEVGNASFSPSRQAVSVY